MIEDKNKIPPIPSRFVEVDSNNDIPPIPSRFVEVEKDTEVKKKDSTDLVESELTTTDTQKDGTSQSRVPKSADTSSRVDFYKIPEQPTDRPEQPLAYGGLEGQEQYFEKLNKEKESIKNEYTPFYDTYVNNIEVFNTSDDITKLRERRAKLVENKNKATRANNYAPVKSLTKDIKEIDKQIREQFDERVGQAPDIDNFIPEGLPDDYEKRLKKSLISEIGSKKAYQFADKMSRFLYGVEVGEETYKQSQDDAYFIARNYINDNEDVVIDKFEKEYQEILKNPDRDLDFDIGDAQWFGQLIGGQKIPLLKTTAVGIAGALTGVGAITTPAQAGYDAAVTGFGGSYKSTYIQARSQGLSPEEAADVALKTAYVGAGGGAFEGVLGGSNIFSKLGAKNLYKGLIDIGVDATGATASQLSENYYKQLEGLEQDLGEGVLENILGEVFFSAGMKPVQGLSNLKAFRGLSEDKQKEVIKGLQERMSKDPEVVEVIVERKLEQGGQETTKVEAEKVEAEIETDAVSDAQTDVVKEEVTSPELRIKKKGEEDVETTEIIEETPPQEESIQDDTRDVVETKTEETEVKGKLPERVNEQIKEVADKKNRGEELTVKEQQIEFNYPEQVKQQQEATESKEPDSGIVFDSKKTEIEAAKMPSKDVLKEKERTAKAKEKLAKVKSDFEQSKKDQKDVDKAVSEVTGIIKSNQPKGMNKSEVNSLIARIRDVAKKRKGFGQALSEVFEIFDSIDQRLDNLSKKEASKKKLAEQTKKHKEIKKTNNSKTRNPFSDIQNSVRGLTTFSPKFIESLDDSELSKKYNEYIDDLNKNGGRKIRENKKEFDDFVSKLTEKADQKIKEKQDDKALKEEVYTYLDSLGETTEATELVMNEFGIEEEQANRLVKSHKNKSEKIEKDLSDPEYVNAKISRLKKKGMEDSEVESALIEMGATEEQAKEAIKIYKQERKILKENVLKNKEGLDKNDSELSEVGRELIIETKELADSDLDLFTNAELEALSLIIDNAKNGWVSGLLWKDFILPVKSAKVAKELDDATPNLSARKLKKLKKALLNNELYKIDHAINALGDKVFYKNVISPLSTADKKAQKYTNVWASLEPIIKKMRKGRKGKKSMFDSTVLIEMYLRGREAQAQGYDGNIIKDHIDATSEHVEKDKGGHTNEEMTRIEELYESLKKKDGNVDIDDLYKNKLTPAEREFIKQYDNIMETEVLPKVKDTQIYRRGGVFKELDGYARRSSLSSDDAIIDQGFDYLNDFRGGSRSGKPSARAASSYERTAITPAIRFDAILNLKEGLKDAYYDYYMTPALQQVFSSLEKSIENHKTDKNEVKQQVITDVRNLMEIVMKNNYRTSKIELKDWEVLAKAIEKQAYMSTLASVKKPIGEFASNLPAVVLYDSKALLEGVKHINDDYSMMMNDVGSTQQGRAGQDSADLSEMDKGMDYSTRKLNESGMRKAASFIDKNDLNKAKTKVGELMITSADKSISNPFWKGVFNKKFKELTGETYDNNLYESSQEYRDKYIKSITEAAKEADYETSLMVNTTSNIEGLGKLAKMSPEEKRNVINKINTFVWRFQKNEFNSALLAAKILFGRSNNEMSKARAFRLLAGIMVRQHIYNIGMQALYGTAKGLLGDDWEEWKEFYESTASTEGILRDIGSSALSLGFGKYGNITRAIVGWGINKGDEWVTEHYRGKEYDYFRDAMMFPQVGEDIKKTRNILKGLGAYSYPSLTLWDAGEILAGTKGDIEDERGQYELLRTIASMADLTLGIPLKKDVDMVLETITREYEKEIERKLKPIKEEIESEVGAVDKKIKRKLR